MRHLFVEFQVRYILQGAVTIKIIILPRCKREKQEAIFNFIFRRKFVTVAIVKVIVITVIVSYSHQNRNYGPLCADC